MAPRTKNPVGLLPMTRQGLLAWKRGHALANEASWAIRQREPKSANEAFMRANSLLRLTGDVVFSAANEEARRQQTEIARARWVALKKKYAERAR